MWTRFRNNGNVPTQYAANTSTEESSSPIITSSHHHSPYHHFIPLPLTPPPSLHHHFIPSPFSPSPLHPITTSPHHHFTISPNNSSPSTHSLTGGSGVCCGVLSPLREGPDQCSQEEDQHHSHHRGCQTPAQVQDAGW